MHLFNNNFSCTTPYVKIKVRFELYKINFTLYCLCDHCTTYINLPLATIMGLMLNLTALHLRMCAYTCMCVSLIILIYIFTYKNCYNFNAN